MMKKILIIGLVLVPLVGYGQSRVGKKISNMTSTSTVNSDAVIPVVQNGANYKTTKSNLQKEVVSTAATNTSNITQLTNNTSGITGFTMTTDGDTVIITYGDESWKLLAVGVEEEDTTPPTVTAVEVGNLSSDTVVVTMSEAMDTGSSNSSFTFTEDGNAYGIGTPIFYSNDTIKIPLDSAAESEKAYLISYSRPGTDDYQDVAGNKLLSFTGTEVVNNVTASSDIYSYMLFENNDDDEMGNMTFTWGGTEAYKTTGSPPQGTYSTNTPGLAYFSTNETHDLGNLWTVAGWFNGGDGSQRYLVEMDEVDIWMDYTTSNVYLEGLVGGQAFTSSQLGAGVQYTWTHMAVTYDGVNGYARTYINGVNVSSDSIVATGADANGIIDILWNGTSFAFYGDMDDLHFYKAVLTDAQILQLKNNPGVPVGGFNDPPIPEGDIEVLWAEDWDDFYITSTLGTLYPLGIPNDSLAANLTNLWYLGSDDANDPDKADNADIVEFDGSNVLKSWYLEGQCCTGAASDLDAPAYGGTGIHTESWITNQSTVYPEVYITYNFFIEGTFINSDGFKTLGVRSAANYQPIANSRLMLIDYTAVSGDLNPALYTTAYWSYPTWETTWGTLDTRTNAKDYDVTKGEWVNITLRCYIGNERGENGRTELFINGIYSGYSVSGVPFVDSGDPVGWNVMSIETFMGGDFSSGYASPQDQWILHDEIVVFRFTDEADVVSGSTPSATGRDITGTLESITELNFPR